MPATYKKIQSVTVTASTAAAIEFTSIPATYTDLMIKLSTRTTQSGVYSAGYISFNDATGTNMYKDRDLYGEGSGTPGSGNSTNNDYTSRISWTTANSATASTFGSSEVYVPNYASSTAKSISADTVSENNATAAIAALGAGLFDNTNAITSFKIIPPTGTNFLQHSSATLYGILKK